MHISIRKVFFNLRLVLLLLGIGVTLLTLQVLHISHYSDRLSALKNQHLLIDKVINTDLSDRGMSSILINGALSEITLAVKRSGEEAFLDAWINTDEEQASLLRSLTLSSQTFQDNVLIWSESSADALASNRERMMNARNAYLRDIDRMADYQIHILGESIGTAKVTVLIVFLIGFFAFFFFTYRLRQIYHDIHRVVSVEAGGSKKEAYTREIDFVLKRLARQPSASVSGPALLHPLSGLNNEKGLIASLNAQRGGRRGNTYLCLFEIDSHEVLLAGLRNEDKALIFKKLGEIISLYAQPLDVIAHTEDDRIVFVMSRNTKKEALEDCEHILKSAEDGVFAISSGTLRLTISAGFLHKIPNKTVEESIADAMKLIEKAKEYGGNRVAELRDRPDAFR